MRATVLNQPGSPQDGLEASTTLSRSGLFRRPQVTLYSAALGVAIAQGCYATGQDHERSVLKKLLGELDLEGVLIQGDALHTQQSFFDSSRSRGPTSS